MSTPCTLTLLLHGLRHCIDVPQPPSDERRPTLLNHLHRQVSLSVVGAGLTCDENEWEATDTELVDKGLNEFLRSIYVDEDSL